jgi:O-antigen/teichoic acid export membrane protein
MANQPPINSSDATNDSIDDSINSGLSSIDLIPTGSWSFDSNGDETYSGELDQDVLTGFTSAEQFILNEEIDELQGAEDDRLAHFNNIRGDEIVMNQYTVNALQRLAGKFRVGDEFTVATEDQANDEAPAAIVHIKSDAGKKSTRNSKVLLTGVLSLVAKGGAAIANIVSLPLLAKYLGQERFGVWLVASSFLTWSSIADLGLANTLKNNLAEADGHDDVQRAIQAITSTIFAICGLTVILLAALLVANPFIPWMGIFNVQQDFAEISAFGLVCSLLFVARIPLAIPNQVYSGYQEGYYYQVISGVTSLLALVMLGLATKLGGDLSALAWAFFGTLMAADILAGLHLFGRHRPELFPHWENFDLATAFKIIRSGLQIWVAQISAIAVFQTDLIIVTQLFGASEAAIYGVALRLFTIISFLQGAFLNPLWPAYTEAAARGDRAWIMTTFRRSIVIGLALSMAVGGVLVIVLPYLVKMWINQNAQVDPLLLAGMLSTAVLITVSSAIAILANGLGAIRSQAILSPAFALFNLVFSILLGKWLGMAGVTIATSIGVLIFSIVLMGGSLRAGIRSGLVLPP